MTRAQQVKRRHVARSRAELVRINPIATAIALQRMRHQMTSVSISIYMAVDGEPETDLLAHTGWMLGIGAEISAIRFPGTAQAKRLHAALRTVIAMSADRAWQASQAPSIDAACSESLSLLTAHPANGLELISSADWLAARIRDGQARLSDVAGAELYSPSNQGNTP